MLKISDIMTRDVVSVSPELSIRDAMDLFAANQVSGAPVVSGKQVVGVISVTDLMRFAASLPGVPEVQDLPRDIEDMDDDNDDEELEPGGDEPVASYFVDMWDDAGAATDVRFAATDGPEWNMLEEHIVSEAMTVAPIQSLPPDTSVDSAAKFMRKNGINRVLVMDNQELLGIVTTTDIADVALENGLNAPRRPSGRDAEADQRGA
jgi:CBS domain-containing protein